MKVLSLPKDEYRGDRTPHPTLLSSSRLSSSSCCAPKSPWNPISETLFSQSSLEPATKPETLVMDKPALVRSKSQIYNYQQQAKASKLLQQATLFDITPAHCDPDRIDPFSLSLYPMSFYRLPADSPGQACIYFVIDSAAQLLLYVGETCRSNKRWKGTHDCKRYIEKYQQLHYQYQLSRSVNMAFWWDTPTNTKSRQQLELALIQLWRSPFNKENWKLWGQPFG